MTRNEQFTSLSHLHRRTKELKSKEKTEWIKATVGNRPGYIIPTHQKPNPLVLASSKRITTRYYQLKTGHAVIGSHMKHIKSLEHDACWWCDAEERQTVHHLFKECQRWRQEREILKGNWTGSMGPPRNRAYLLQ